MDWIFISNNVPSLKNSKVIGRYYKDGKPVPTLQPSKTHRRYEKATEAAYAIQAKTFRKMVEGLPKPYYVLFHFVRDSKRQWDFTNATDTVQDLMVKAGWVDDDNVDEMIPLYANHQVNKEKAGVYISILTPETNYQERLFEK